MLTGKNLSSRILAPALLLAGAGLGLLSCSDSVSKPAAVVSDSAGVRLVEHGPLTDAIAFSVGDPVYRVGWSGTDHEFARVVSGVLLSGARAAVGDMTRDEIVVLSASGEVEVVLGGSGEGPGELGQLIFMSSLPGDTIVVEDDGNARIALFQGDQVVRSHRVQAAMAVLGLRGIGLQDRMLIMETSAYSPFFEQPWLQAPIVRYSLDAQQFDTAGFYDFRQRISADLNQTPNPLRPGGHLGVTEGAILVGRGDLTQIKMLDLDGRTSQIIRWLEERAPLTDEFWSEYAAGRSARERRRTAEEMAEYLTELRATVDEPIPIAGGIRGDRVGRVWVSEYPADYRHPSRFRVFDADGEWLGWVDMPPRTEILDIGQELILAIQRDDLDVEAVVMLPLEPLAR